MLSEHKSYFSLLEWVDLFLCGGQFACTSVRNTKPPLDFTVRIFSRQCFFRSTSSFGFPRNRFLVGLLNATPQCCS